MGKILIIGDVHGRQFWKDACYNHKGEFDKIIFEGDYLAPYPEEEISNTKAIEVFKEILEFKKKNPEKVILLIGNHDLSYYKSDICRCRTDFRNWNMLNELFRDNNRLFDLAWEITINGKRYFFSHAGVRKKWLKVIAGIWFKWDNCNKLPDAQYFNNFFHLACDNEENIDVWDKFVHAVSIYSKYRGWDGEDYGSIVWADIREYAEDQFNLDEDEGREFPDVMFICGHTQLENKPIIMDWVADLDVRRPFVLDTETGEIGEFYK